jgi:hypothetical protein
MSSVLELLRWLVNFGYYATQERLRTIVAPVIKLINGMEDLATDKQTQFKSSLVVNSRIVLLLLSLLSLLLLLLLLFIVIIIIVIIIIIIMIIILVVVRGGILRLFVL